MAAVSAVKAEPSMNGRFSLGSRAAFDDDRVDPEDCP